MRQGKPVSAVFIAPTGDAQAARSPSPASTRQVNPEHIWIGAFVLFAALVPFIYIALTHQIWEDFFITFRHSRNFVDGNGLVFNIGERVHGFTSAINTMLPALFYWITGRHGYETALNLYRAVSLCAFVTGGVILLRLIMRDRGTDRLSPLLFTLLFVTEAKSVSFTMNGQEAGFMICFLGLAFAFAYQAKESTWWTAGLAWAGLLYTRPDAPVFIAALSIASLVFRKTNSRAVFLGLLKSAALAAAIYLPWFIAMWVYYGSPIPHTAVAKPNFTIDELVNPIRLLSRTLQMYPLVSRWIFMPAYALHGGWPDWLLDPYSFLCALVATTYWMIRSDDRLGRMASLIFMLIALYLSLVNVESFAFPWYMPSAAVFSSIVLARALPEFARRIPVIRFRAMLAARIAQGSIVVVSLLLLIGVTMQIRIQQHELEDNHRKLIGLYLREHMSRGERAYMEPLGYIGYFSEQNIQDWPGLVSPEVVRLRREKKLNQISVITELKPEWVVFRESELQLAALIPEIEQNYIVSHVFDARDRLAAYSYIPGRGSLDFDAVLVVVQRKKAAQDSQPDH